MTDPALSRRRALTLGGVGGLSLPLLAACGSGSARRATPRPTGRQLSNDGSPTRRQEPALGRRGRWWRPRTSRWAGE